MGVVDYESKPIDKLEAWYEQEQELIRAYKEYLVNNHRREKKCGNYWILLFICFVWRGCWGDVWCDEKKKSGSCDENGVEEVYGEE